MANFWLGVGATIIMEFVLFALIVTIKVFKTIKSEIKDKENNKE